MTGPQGVCLLAPIHGRVAVWPAAVEVDVQPVRVRPPADVPLTVRQRRIVNFIAAYMAEHHYSPSYREIAKGAGLRSMSTVVYQVGVLRRLGVLDDADQRARPRALRLIQGGA